MNEEPADRVMILLVSKADLSRNLAGSFQVIKDLDTAGLSSTAGPYVRFREFYIPEENILVEPGKAGAIIERAFTSSAALVGAMATGIMSAAFEAALSFAKSDARGGAVSLLSRQSVSDILIDIKCAQTPQER